MSTALAVGIFLLAASSGVDTASAIVSDVKGTDDWRRRGALSSFATTSFGMSESV